jgi:NAD(P)-dependent dehydrogenase (short-subunit alcohol dehydrogenase family)
VVITGANSGIGRETAIDLAKRGAKVYMACRDREKMEAARQEIMKCSGSNSIFAMDLDLASFDSIRKFVKT